MSGLLQEINQRLQVNGRHREIRVCDSCRASLRPDVSVYRKCSHSLVMSCIGKEARLVEIYVFQPLKALEYFKNEIQLLTSGRREFLL